MLLVVAFASAFIGLEHVYGACTLSFLAVALLGTALIRFGHDVRWASARLIIIDEPFEALCAPSFA